MLFKSPLNIFRLWKLPLNRWKHNGSALHIGINTANYIHLSPKCLTVHLNALIPTQSMKAPVRPNVGKLKTRNAGDSGMIKNWTRKDFSSLRCWCPSGVLCHLPRVSSQTLKIHEETQSGSGVMEQRVRITDTQVPWAASPFWKRAERAPDRTMDALALARSLSLSLSLSRARVRAHVDVTYSHFHLCLRQNLAHQGDSYTAARGLPQKRQRDFPPPPFPPPHHTNEGPQTTHLRILQL